MHVSPPKHLARRGGRSDLSRNPEYVLESLIGLAVVLIMVTVVANLPDRSESRATPGEQASGTTAGSLPAKAPMSGNLVTNWSFEQDLGGWEVVGAVDAVREPPGRTSGSCALVRARGPQPGRVGLRLPAAVTDAPKGSRYVAKAWVRSTAPGLRVTLRLVGAGAKPEASQATAATLPGLAWRAVMVDHTVAAAGELAVEITADGVAPGDALLVDEVIVRQG
jgi:hypothetical protein